MPVKYVGRHPGREMVWKSINVKSIDDLTSNLYSKMTWLLVKGNQKGHFAPPLIFPASRTVDVTRCKDKIQYKRFVILLPWISLQILSADRRYREQMQSRRVRKCRNFALLSRWMLLCNLCIWRKCRSQKMPNHPLGDTSEFKPKSGLIMLSLIWYWEACHNKPEWASPIPNEHRGWNCAI